MQRQSRRSSGRSGFTLLEILIVLAIIGVIAAMAVPRLVAQQREANVKATRGTIKGVESGLQMYAVDNNGLYPEGGQEQLTLLAQPRTGTDGRALEPILKAPPLDAWGRPLFYEYPNTKVQLNEPAIWSSGPDGKNDNGGGDDINNWATPTATR